MFTHAQETYEQKKDNQKVLYIDSSKRSGGNSNSFTVNLDGNELTNVKSFSVLSLEIPNTFRNITSNNNTLRIVEQTGPQILDVTIPPGFYDIQSLSDSMMTLLNAASVVGGNSLVYTITASIVTSKMTISTTIPIQLIIANSSIGPSIGFTQNSSIATSIISDNYIKLQGPTCIYIDSNISTNYVNQTGAITTILFKQQINVPWGNTIFYRNLNPDIDTCVVNNTQFRNFTFRLVDIDRKLMDNLNYDWSMTLAFFTG